MEKFTRATKARFKGTVQMKGRRHRSSSDVSSFWSFPYYFRNFWFRTHQPCVASLISESKIFALVVSWNVQTINRLLDPVDFSSCHPTKKIQYMWSVEAMQAMKISNILIRPWAFFQTEPKFMLQFRLGVRFGKFWKKLIFGSVRQSVTLVFYFFFPKTIITKQH